MDDEKTIDQDVQRLISGEETPEKILARIRARRRAEAQETAGEDPSPQPVPPETAPSEKAAVPPTVPPRPAEGAGYAAPPPSRGIAPSQPVRRPEGPAPGERQPLPQPDRNASAYREYMHSARRPSVYSDASADDAYDAAYRDAMRKAAGEKTESGAARARAVVGTIVMLFAVFGLGCAVFFGVKGIDALARKREQTLCEKYNARLVAVAAVDPASFDDLSDASMADLIKVSLWSIVGAGVDPNRYRYEDGELCVPAADVEAAYAAFFGNQRPIVHGSAEGYGYTFQYSEEDAAYYIPMTTLEPLYTPRVTAVETKSGATVVTCGFISSGLWMQDARTGDIAVPEPDRYVRVTFRSVSGTEYVSALQSLGMPETALPSGGGTTAPAASSRPETAETTTGQNIVITWD